MRKASNLPSEIYLYDKKVTSSQEIADLFVSHFESVYSSDSIVPPDFHFDHSFHLSNIKNCIADIFMKLFNLNTSKGAGIDGIPPIFFKSCCFALSHPLYIIFNNSLSTSVFPNVWKNSLVSPIFKSGEPEDIMKYRPI